LMPTFRLATECFLLDAGLADIADMKTFAMTLPVPPASGPDTQERLQASLNALKSLW
jgi:hypothetical protein